MACFWTARGRSPLVQGPRHKGQHTNEINDDDRFRSGHTRGRPGPCWYRQLAAGRHRLWDSIRIAPPPSSGRAAAPCRSPPRYTKSPPARREQWKKWWGKNWKIINHRVIPLSGRGVAGRGARGAGIDHLAGDVLHHREQRGIIRVKLKLSDSLNGRASVTCSPTNGGEGAAGGATPLPPPPHT